MRYPLPVLGFADDSDAGTIEAWVESQAPAMGEALGDRLTYSDQVDKNDRPLAARVGLRRQDCVSVSVLQSDRGRSSAR